MFPPLFEARAQRRGLMRRERGARPGAGATKLVCAAVGCVLVLTVLPFVPILLWTGPSIPNDILAREPAAHLLTPKACRHHFSRLDTAKDLSASKYALDFLRGVGLPQPTSFPCSPIPSNLSIDTHRPILVAANLRDAEHVLPNMALQLLLLASRAPPSSIFISIYASGSSDSTPQMLTAFDRALTTCGIPHTIVPDGNLTRSPSQPRIPFLAALRNAALHPLTSGTFAAASVVFINDVFFCAEAIPRLLSYGADIACGMDFEPILADLPSEQQRAVMAKHMANRLRVPGRLAAALSRRRTAFKLWRRLYGRSTAALDLMPLLFYDTWVARDAAGGRITRRQPYARHAQSQLHLSKGEPVRVQCCWNGLVALAAQPLASGRITFRSNHPGECAASECSLACDDYWRAGHQRFVMDPAVRVAYKEVAAKKLYSEAVEGLPSRPPAVPQPQRLAHWQGADAGVGGVVECCPLQPGLDKVDFDHGCYMVNVSSSNKLGE